MMRKSRKNLNRVQQVETPQVVTNLDPTKITTIRNRKVSMKDCQKIAPPLPHQSLLLAEERETSYIYIKVWQANGTVNHEVVP